MMLATMKKEAIEDYLNVTFADALFEMFNGAVNASVTKDDSGAIKIIWNDERPQPKFQEVENFRSKLKLDRLKEYKSNLVRVMFQVAQSENYTVKSGQTLQADYDSVQALDGAVRLVEQAGLKDVVLYGADNTPKTYSVKEAKDIITELAVRWQGIFAKKQSLLVELNSLNSLGEVEAFTPEFKNQKE